MAKSPAEKLGLKPGLAGWAHNRPAALAEALPFPAKPPTKEPDVTVAFVHTAAEVPGALQAVAPRYQRGKALWFAYPKKSSALQADISRDRGWEPLTAAGLLPVTQVALDETWSALRFRYRDEIPKLTRKFS